MTPIFFYFFSGEVVTIIGDKPSRFQMHSGGRFIKSGVQISTFKRWGTLCANPTASILFKSTKKIYMRALIIVMGVVSIVLKAWTATHLWAWFIAGSYGMPVLRFSSVLAGLVIVRILFESKPRTLKDNNEVILYIVADYIVCCVVLLIGWCLKH